MSAGEGKEGKEERATTEINILFRAGLNIYQPWP
jgi:hypothetical protein